MKKSRFLLLALYMILANLMMTTSIIDIKAATTQTTYSGSNLGRNDYYEWNNWSQTRDSYLSFENDKIFRLQQLSNQSLLIENYDLSYNFLDSKMINAEAEVFGGAYFTSDANYLVWGNNNPDEDNTKEVFRISKYDKNWNYIKSCGLNGANTTVPFDAGSCDMAMSGTNLIIRTCHEMYQSEDGKNHQANVSIVVNSETMEVASSVTDVVYYTYGYGSHSFNQKIESDGNAVIMVDHIDAYPTRAFELYKFAGLNGNALTDATYRSVYDFKGNIGNNYTGAALGGLAISSTNYLVAGNSVTQDDNYATNKTRNIFVVACDKELSSTSINWLTNYSEGEEKCTAPYIEKINNNRFVVIWSRVNDVYYTFVDGNGQTISETLCMKGAALSDCEPVLNGNKLVWYTWKNEEIKFYEINMDDEVHPSVVTLNNGVRDEKQFCSNGIHEELIDCEQVEPTCSEKGVKAHRVCSRCKQLIKVGSDSEIIDATSLEILELGHDWINHKEVVATCGANGNVAYKECSRCYELRLMDDSVVEDEASLVINKLEHQYMYYPMIEATCLNEGKRGYQECIYCAKKTMEDGSDFDESALIIPRSDHDWIYHSGVEATCMQDGYMEYQECMICGAMQSMDGSELISGSLTIPRLEHDWVNYEEVPPTCTTPGSAAYQECRMCLTRYEMPGSGLGYEPLGHDWIYYGEIEPTCDTYGSKAYQECSRCYEKQDMDGGPYFENQAVIEPLGHDYIYYERVEPTCISEGKLEYQECSRCYRKTLMDGSYIGDIRRLNIPKIEHNWIEHEEVAATCEANGNVAYKECSSCHELRLMDDSVVENEASLVINKLEHQYIYYPMIEATCLNEGKRGYQECIYCAKKTMEDGSDFDESALIIPRSDHDWIYHSGVEATCMQDGYMEYQECMTCGAMQSMDGSELISGSLTIPRLEHDWVNYEEVPPTCTTPGSAAYQECRMCLTRYEMPGGGLGYEPLGHDYIYYERVEPTCISEGKLEYQECSRCYKKILMDGSVVEDSDLVIQKVEHDYKFSHQSNGKSYYKCINCGKEIESETTFKDVSSKAWYMPSVYDIYAKGLMRSTGRGENYFEPDMYISRGMVATVLYRMAGAPKVNYIAKFPDVKNNLWYTNAIIWINNVGVVSGLRDGTYGPDIEITRQDLAIMLRNYACIVGKLDTNQQADLSRFIDKSSVSDYAKSALQWAVANGIMSGKDNGTRLAPHDKATRAESAKMFNTLTSICETN